MNADRYSLAERHSSESFVAVGAEGARTAREFCQDVALLVRALAQLSPQTQRPILAITDRYRFAVALLACWSSGRVVALPPNGQTDLLRKLALEQDGLLIHDGDAIDGLDVRAALAQPAPETAFAPFVLPAAQPLVVIFTSGSTGERQPAEKTGAQLLGEAALQGQLSLVAPADRVLATVPPQHIYGLLFGILVPLMRGAAFSRGTPLHAEAVAAAAREIGATILVSVPAHLRGLEALSSTALPSSIRLVLSSGAPLDARTQAVLAKLSLPVREILGSTETGGMAVRDPLVDAAWRPLPGLQIAAGEDGQLLLDSPFLPREVARPLACADRIELNPDGSFAHKGRLDDVVKIAGKRLALSEMEARLRELPGVREVALFARATDVARGAELFAVVAGVGPTRESIRAALLRSFDPVVLPRHLRIVEKLPVDANGKPGRALLLALFEKPTQAAADPEHKRLSLALQSHEQHGATELFRLEGVVPAELHWFRGHFEGFPILAGVVQLRVLVLAECRLRWPDLGPLRRLARIKFRSPISASQQIVLTLRRERSSASVQYEITRGGNSCSSGMLEFEPVAP